MRKFHFHTKRLFSRFLWLIFASNLGDQDVHHAPVLQGASCRDVHRVFSSNNFKLLKGSPIILDVAPFQNVRYKPVRPKCIKMQGQNLVRCKFKM